MPVFQPELFPLSVVYSPVSYKKCTPFLLFFILILLPDRGKEERKWISLTPFPFAFTGTLSKYFPAHLMTDMLWNGILNLSKRGWLGERNRVIFPLLLLLSLLKQLSTGDTEAAR